MPPVTTHESLIYDHTSYSFLNSSKQYCNSVILICTLQAVYLAASAANAGWLVEFGRGNMHLHSLSTQHTNISQDINICRHKHSHPLVPHKPHIPILPLVQTPAAHSATRTLPRGPCRTRTISLSFSLSDSLSFAHMHTLTAHCHWQLNTLTDTQTLTDIPLSDPVPILEHCSARLHARSQRE